MKFTNVLVYVDATRKSLEALRVAAQLQADHGARLSIVDVVPEAPAAETDRLWADVQRMVLTDRREQLERRAADAGLDASGPEIDVLRGSRASRIAEVAQANGHDLIIKAAYGREEDSPSSAPGVVAARLIRLGPCPVWVVQSAAGERENVVAAAVDPLGDRTLARRVLSTAASVAVDGNGSLAVLTACDLQGEALLRKRSEADADAYVESVHARYGEALASLIAESGLDAASVETHLLDGPADAVIEAFVRQRRPRLLVAGTVAREGLLGYVVGNTAERLVRSVDTSLLVVGPTVPAESDALPSQERS